MNPGNLTCLASLQKNDLKDISMFEFLFEKIKKEFMKYLKGKSLPNKKYFI
jgi:hypothetical protein